MAETKTPEAPEEKPKEKPEKPADKTEGKDKEKKGDVPRQTTDEMRDRIRKELEAERQKTSEEYHETPWQKMHDAVDRPAKTATKVGLFILNPVVYSSVYAADWLAQRTPGVKHLYKAPREIIRNTASRTMDVLVGGATLVPSLPFTIGHEISDKLHGMDTSKPRNIIGKGLDKLGDLIGGTLNLTKKTLEYVVPRFFSIVEKTLKVFLMPFGSIFNGIGKAYGALAKHGGITGFAGMIGLTALLAGGGHLAIGGILGAMSPAAAAAYHGFLDTLLLSLRSLWPG